MNELEFINDFFNEVLSVSKYDDRGVSFNKVTNSYPFTDIFVNDNEDLIFNMALAGYSKENISIEVENNMLFIKGFYKSNVKPKEVLLNGIKKTDFEKSFTLPDWYVTEPEVFFDSGLLIIIFKKSESRKRKTITIK